MAARESNQQSDKPTLSMIIQVCRGRSMDFQIYT